MFPTRACHRDVAVLEILYRPFARRREEHWGFKEANRNSVYRVTVLLYENKACNSPWCFALSGYSQAAAAVQRVQWGARGAGRALPPLPPLRPCPAARASFPHGRGQPSPPGL